MITTPRSFDTCTRVLGGAYFFTRSDVRLDTLYVTIKKNNGLTAVTMPTILRPRQLCRSPEKDDSCLKAPCPHDFLELATNVSQPLVIISSS
jgi:hypothetical protein